MDSDRLPNTTELVILSILVSGERYGVEIREQFARQGRRTLPYGSLYTTLHRIEDKGLVTSRLASPDKRRGGRRRKYFHLTAKGRRALDDVALCVGATNGVLS